MMKHILAGAALALVATAAQADVVTPADLQGWAPANVRANGAVEITGAYKPAGETGSLQFTTNTGSAADTTDKADYVHALNGTLGDLINGGALSFDYFVDSSSTVPEYLAPALRLGFLDEASGKTGYLIWEDVYNGGAVGTSVPNDTWVSNDILGGNFWLRSFSPGFTVENYGVSLSEWAGGQGYTTPGGTFSLSAATRILSVEVGVGSGWGGAFNGAVDHVLVDFGTGSGGVSANFESGVPEPGAWALMILGFGGVGAVLRRRQAVAA
ncbi:PEPxxWA-CTERM sorting domain-containing protein [Phenylobacterium sp.]|uniref:PEPxxWA-CTERM sorting domain-containing protein n=1 Tax=Phenylobacterium sp. TaxID=1871053 RepID=UPI0025CD0CB5|nr:PEPxxWA-CTERM sorting domain-containing protein [Phenylobacterium sp.]MBX3484571.1 PEP-CTERM sorting domain-containing protein [Phenylobacterium sp.]MCW5759688.1 PEP-CTERM sorting domain-containing protein [Phenylobacterium sp.]